MNRKGNCKNRKEHEEKLCRLAFLRSKLILVEKWEADLHSIKSKFENVEEEISHWRAKSEILRKIRGFLSQVMDE